MPSVLADLRTLVPRRALTIGEALRIAELQAFRLLAGAEISVPPVPEAFFTNLPRIQINRMAALPMSGATHWSKGRWVITLNGDEGILRQRFSLAHEIKHVLDAPFGNLLYPPFMGMSTQAREEGTADFFSACLLMPRAWVKKAWREGLQTPEILARLFAVSPTAMRVRLQSLGLLERTPRCSYQVRRAT